MAIACLSHSSAHVSRCVRNLTPRTETLCLAALQGPFTLADYVGLDTTLSILKNWTSMYPGEPAFIVPKSLEVKVRRQLSVLAPASRVRGTMGGIDVERGWRGR